MAKSKRASKAYSSSSSKGGNNGNHKNYQHKATAGETTSSTALASTANETRYIRVFPIDWGTLVVCLGNFGWITALSMLLGFGMGAGWLLIGVSQEWRLKLALAIRSSPTFRLATLRPGAWNQASVDTWTSVAYV